MADSNIAITQGSGINIDTRTEATNGHHRQVVTLGDPSTNAGVAPVDATAGLKVDLGADNDVTVTGTVTANLAAGTNAIGKLAANSGVDIGDVDVLTVNGVAPAFGSGARGATVQRVTIATDDVVPAAQSGVWTVQPGNTANTTAWKVDGSAVTQPVSMATNTPVGNVAHDAGDSGNPIKVGAKADAVTSTSTMVADGDRTDLTSDLDGAVITRPQIPLGDLISEALSNTDGASTASTAFGATASTRSYITAAHVFRTDAGTTPIYVDFRDGTGGSVLYRMVIPPNGGAILPAGATPYFRTSANTALAFDVSAATTTVYISLSGFKSKV